MNYQVASVLSTDICVKRYYAKVLQVAKEV